MNGAHGIETRKTGEKQMEWESSDGPSPVGLRERGKQEKLRRIKESAREIFRSKGYELATTREIAARAEVAYGTLFAYARNKHDLLLMLVNDDLDAVTGSAFKSASQPAPLIDQLVEFFRPRIEYWASEPEFSRYAVREMFEFVTHGEDSTDETARFRARRPQLVKKLTELITHKQEQGRIDPDESPEMIAWLFMAIYLSENRQWLEAHRQNPEAVIARLRHLLGLAIRGVTAHEIEWRGNRAG
jgi:AcrR family transcriptional regulator